MKILALLEKIGADWGGVILWIIVCAAAKISNANKTIRQSRGEIIGEAVYAIFGGLLAYLTIKGYKDLVWKWIIITAGAIGGADLVKWFSFNIRDLLDIAGNVIKSKIKKQLKK